MKKTMSMLMSGLLVVSSVLPAASAASNDATYSDISGHWASSEISEWSGLGVIKGYDGKFRPDESVTRGEFAVILSRVMAYQSAASNSFSDLKQDFYTDAVLKAAYVGVMKGFSNGTIQPTANITRQDAMCMIARAFKLHATSGYKLQATDASEISSYATDSLAALESLGAIKGRADGKICPKDEITRAEIVKILDNLVSTIYSTAGTYTKDATGDVVVNAADVVLKGMTINGDLVIAPGVGNGDCTLDGVTVKGNVVVLGGGVNSVKIIGSSSVTGKVYIDKVGDAVRVYTEQGVEIPSVVVEDGSNDVKLEGTFKSVEVNADVKVTIPAGTTVQNLALNAKAEVAGAGTVAQATLSAAAAGASFETKPTAVSAPTGVTVSIGGTSYTSTDTGLTATNTTTTTTTTSGGGGGGGSSTTTVSTTGVTLYVNGSTEIAGTGSSGSYSFDLSGYPDDTTISGIKVATSSASTYTVGNYSIDTNTQVPVSTFLGMLSLSTSKNVTLSKIRALGDTCSFTGTVNNGSALTVTFNVGTSGAYSYTTANVSGVTTITASLKSSASSTTLSDFSAALATDPVSLLVQSITNTSAGTYTLGVTNGTLSFSKGYAYSDISGLNTTTLLSKIGAKGNYATLGDLTGMHITITYPNGTGTKTVALVFA